MGSLCARAISASSPTTKSMTKKAVFSSFVPVPNWLWGTSQLFRPEGAWFSVCNNSSGYSSRIFYFFFNLLVVYSKRATISTTAHSLVTLNSLSTKYLTQVEKSIIWSTGCAHSHFCIPTIQNIVAVGCRLHHGLVHFANVPSFGHVFSHNHQAAQIVRLQHGMVQIRVRTVTRTRHSQSVLTGNLVELAAARQWCNDSFAAFLVDQDYIVGYVTGLRKLARSLHDAAHFVGIVAVMLLLCLEGRSLGRLPRTGSRRLLYYRRCCDCSFTINIYQLLVNTLCVVLLPKGLAMPMVRFRFGLIWLGLKFIHC